MECPHCGRDVPAAIIPDDLLKSERGRRNAARRKTFGPRRKGQMQIWTRHNPAARRCRCRACLLANITRLAGQLEDRIRTFAAATGVRPEWASEERSRLRRMRSRIEWALLEKELEAAGGDVAVENGVTNDEWCARAGS